MSDVLLETEVELDGRASTISDPLLRQIAQAPAIDSYDPIGHTLAGRYQVLALLGQGGMGRVFEAEDLELGRRVAIKLVRAAAFGRTRDRERFLHERTVTAALEHPAIIPVYDAGVAPNGEPFFVMRRATGERLDRLIARAPTLSARLALIASVTAMADAVAFAHRQGILHGDLKPSNVLIGDSGETMVADWGLARSIHAGDRVSTAGTPAYMAPEQVAGQSVDERCDVYALGATLFHVLAGRPPGGPSDVAAELASAPADAVAIMRKALAAEPGARYACAAELAHELRRFQTGKIVRARRYTRTELLRRWARGHRAALSLAGALAALLATVLAVGVVHFLAERGVQRAQRAEAETARREAERRKEELLLFEARAELVHDPSASVALLKAYPLGGARWKAAAAIAADARARGVARHVWDLGRPIGSIAFSPDGRTLVAGARDGTLTLIDVEGGPRRALHAANGVGARAVFSPDGAWLATSDDAGAARLWDAQTGGSLTLAGGPDLRFSSDGKLLAAGRPGEPVRLWRVPSGERFDPPGEPPALGAFMPDGLALAARTELALPNRARLRLASPARALAAAPDGAWLAAITGGELVVWRPASGARVRIAAPADRIGLLLASPDGRRILGCAPREAGAGLWLFDLEHRAVAQLSSEERCSRQPLAWAPDGASFVSTGPGSELRVHDVADGRVTRLAGHDGAVSDAAFAPDGRSIGSASSDGTVRLWPWGEGDVRLLHDAIALDRMSASGELLVADAETGAVALVDVRGGGRRELGGPRPAELRGRGALSRDGAVAVIPVRGALLVHDLRAGTVRRLDGDAGDGAAALSPDGAALARADANGAVWVVALASGRRVTLGTLDDAGLAVSWSDDGRRVAAGCRSGAARVYDVITGIELGGLEAPTSIRAVSLSPDGGRLVVACDDGTVRALTLATGAQRIFRGHAGMATSVALAADVLLSAGADGTVRMWSLATGAGLVVRREPAAVSIASLAPDGALLVTSGGGEVRVSDARLLPPPAADPARLKAWIGSLTTAEVDATGRLATPCPGHP